MGNAMGFKDKNKENISIFEKRYGYNLNDLHSYIYKINLPLKPRYVNYVLEEKKKTNSKKGQDEYPDDMIVENKETDKMEAEQPCHHDYNDETKEDIFLKNNLNAVDLYQTYEKDNINDSRNIYKNKLIINNNRQNEKYEDKYVHMSYDNNYLYDNHTNNIYTDENISNYIFQQNNISTNHKKGNQIKTYVNLCLNYYNNLDTCVIKKYEKNVQSKKYKYTRLHTCKPHYVLFSRCIKYRDKKLMKEIKKIELNYYNSLNNINKGIYLNEFLTNLNYHEYLIGKLHDSIEKIKLNKELNELRERYDHIIKHKKQMNDNLSKYSNEKGNRSVYKRFMLLNV
ncbi:conserved Plasmodium protein, unknown function [Plasmodium sp. DRC-Itaito]|nr:conserved Plasmodium protein, unknown function [Plasmodium sp. DRC-Itaito]